jgi:plasmid stabilization system protein ParE
VTNVRWTEQAVADLRSIREFIERELFPRSGRVVPELSRDDVRELIVGDYRIVYRLDNDVAVLLTRVPGLPTATRDWAEVLILVRSLTRVWS